MWKCFKKHEAPWKYKSSLLSLSSLVLQSTGELYRKARQSGSESGERKSSKNPLFWGGWVLCKSFFLEKKNLNNQNTEKRKEQRVTLLQVITIYYRNSSDTQFWLQPWWAERRRQAAKRGHLLCSVSWSTKDQVPLGNDVLLSHLWVFGDHFKYQLSQTHFPLQSCPSPCPSPAFSALQPTNSKHPPPCDFIDFSPLPSYELQIELTLSRKNQSFPWERPVRPVIGGGRVRWEVDK